MDINLHKLEMTPTCALVVYERNPDEDLRGRGVSRNIEGVSNFYVEAHSILSPVPGRYTLGEGAPITYANMGRLAGALKEEANALGVVSGLFPERLLYSDQKPGLLRLLFYDPPQPERRYLGNHCHVIGPSPGLLYLVDNMSLYVFATDAPGRPDATTNLLHTGWSNISLNGSVCLGSTQFNRYNTTYEESLRQWTGAFWLTEFTGLTKNSAEAKRLQECHEKNAPYPLDKLKPADTFTRFLRNFNL